MNAELTFAMVIVFIIKFVIPFLLAYSVSVYLCKKYMLFFASGIRKIFYSAAAFVTLFFLSSMLIPLPLILIPNAGILFLAGSLAIITFLPPLLLYSVVYISGSILVAWRLNQIYSINISTGTDAITSLPDSSKKSNAVLILLGIAFIAILLHTFSVQASTIKVAVMNFGAKTFQKPEWCTSSNLVLENQTEENRSIADCIESSLPQGKTIYDYCEQLPGSPRLDRVNCETERFKAENNPAGCRKGKGPRFFEYNICIANFVGTKEHKDYCEEMEKTPSNINFTNLTEAKCLSSSNVNIADPHGRTALFYAKTPADQDELLSAGADVNHQDTEGVSALSLQVNDTFRERTALIANLLKHSADANLVDSNGNSPLLLAVQKNDFVTAVLLIKNGANIRTTNKEGKNICDYNLNEELSKSCNKL